MKKILVTGAGGFIGHHNNIKRINCYKQKYNTEFPKLTWQFIVFGHNEYEIPAARNMARELNMDFQLKFNSDPTYSPVRDKEFVKSEMCYESLTAWDYLQINRDGKLLGCCCNSNPFPVNVFETGFKKSLKNEEFIYAKKMLSGKKGPKGGIPCSDCPAYKWRKEKNRFLSHFPVRIILYRIIHNLFPGRFNKLQNYFLGQ